MFFWGLFTGAVVAGVVGYYLWCEQGRKLRKQLFIQEQKARAETSNADYYRERRYELALEKDKLTAHIAEQNVRIKSLEDRVHLFQCYWQKGSV